MKYFLILISLCFLTANSNEPQIRGGTDYTKIGNVSDRLKVDSQVTSISGLPATKSMKFLVHLKNGSATDMNVNGSSVNVSFDATPASGETWYVTSLNFLIIDTGTMNFGNYGALAGLTNGTQLLIRADGTEYNVIPDTLKDNADIAKTFRFHPYVTPTSGFFETSDVYMGTMIFDPPLVLTNSTSDYIRMKIRDNLTGLDIQEVVAEYWRAI